MKEMTSINKDKTKLNPLLLVCGNFLFHIFILCLLGSIMMVDYEVFDFTNDKLGRFLFNGILAFGGVVGLTVSGFAAYHVLRRFKLYLALLICVAGIIPALLVSSVYSYSFLIFQAWV